MNYTQLASQESIEKTIAALKEHNFNALVVATKADALAKIHELIPAGASLMKGSSETLREIGFVDLLKSKDHPWNNLHDDVLAETDPEKQAKLRRESVLSDFYLGSAHAVTETGELMVASNTGSQLPHLVFTSKYIILVVGAQKIVPSMQTGFARIDEHVLLLEDERMKGVYGFGTFHAKTLILHKENPAMGRSIHVILVNEVLGF